MKTRVPAISEGARRVAHVQLPSMNAHCQATQHASHTAFTAVGNPRTHADVVLTLAPTAMNAQTMTIEQYR